MIRHLAIGFAVAALAAAPALAQRDGTPGNPPSTATQRTLDRATGSPPTPADGTRGNQPGTAAGRAMDRNLGTNTTGTDNRNPAAESRRRSERTGTTPGTTSGTTR